MNDNFELDKNLYELLQKGSLEIITLINLGGISSIELYADIHTVKRSPNENSIIVIPFWVNNEPVYLKIYFDKNSPYNNKVFDELIPMTSVDMQVLPRWNIESNCIEFDFDGLLAKLLEVLHEDDILMITADHGNVRWSSDPDPLRLVERYHRSAAGLLVVSPLLPLHPVLRYGRL